MTRALSALLALAVAVLPVAPAGAKPLTLKLGTLAAQGTPWHAMLVRIDEGFRNISGGEVKLGLYAGGVLGDEPDLVKKMRIGQLHGAGLTSVGTSLLDEGILSLHLPMMFDTYDELDWVRDRITVKLEADLAKRGFVLLTWTDGGWVYYFSKTPILTIADLRRVKLFVWGGDAKSLELYTAAKCRPVPLAATDMLPGLQTGLIDAYDTIPLASLVNQWFALAPYMTDLKWAPLMGAVIVTKKAWDQVPADWRPKMLDAAKAASRATRADIRRLGEEAIPEMTKRGLKIVKPDAAQLAEWRREVEAFWPHLRGKMGSAAYFDEVMKLRTEYRAKKQ
jgi:TRAP-type C4-dicarboxylate transport system substrate-binding protein